MSTKEQSATLLRLNKQEQVKALQAVGFADITETRVPASSLTG